MIKAKLNGAILLGFSEGNLSEFRKGKPMIVSGKDWDLGFDIIIVYGETEKAILTSLQPMMSKDTKITGVGDDGVQTKT